MIKIWNMDVMKALKQMPDESVDMQITSPPYWGLRDYGEGTETIWDGDKNCKHKWNKHKQAAKGRHTKPENMPKVGSNLTQQDKDNMARWGYESNFCSLCGAWKGQLGLEPDFNLFIKHLADVFDEVKRVLKKDGTCWVNLGDNYSGSKAGNDQPKYKNLANRNTFKKEQSRDVPAKCLCCIPERFIIEMINRGWILRNKIIWHKPNHMPTSVKDRFANSWEYLFMFSKSKKYYFDLDAVREAHIHGKGAKFNLRVKDVKRGYAEKSGQYKASEKEVEQYHGQSINYSPKGKNPDDVIQTKFSEGDGYRQGMNRDETELIEIRLNLPPQEEIVGFLEEWTNGFEDTLDEEFGEYKWRHWIRSDSSGFSYPSRRDWMTLKNMLDFTDTYDKQMLDFILKPNAVISNEFGKNPSDFWDITTRGYPEAHFAVFPEALVERPIKTTPKWICNKCGKARERITENEFIKTSDASPSKIGDSRRNPEIRTDLPANRGYTLRHTKGFTDCKCNAGFHPAVILDIFAGSGTTLKVARRLNRDAIGIEIKKDYCDLIKKRLFGNNQTLFPNEFKVIK